MPQIMMTLVSITGYTGRGATMILAVRELDGNPMKHLISRSRVKRQTRSWRQPKTYARCEGHHDDCSGAAR